MQDGVVSEARHAVTSGLLAVAGALYVLAGALCLLSAPSAAAASSAPAGSDGPESEYVGRERCTTCHKNETAHWDPTLHGRLFSGAPRTELEGRGCEACHGPGSRHAADPYAPDGIVAFTRGADASVERMNAMCLACHDGGTRIHWRGSIHEAQGLACSDCHNPMGRQSVWGLQSRSQVSATCFTCHPQQRADFRKRSRMPLLEGKLSCADCHAPHGSFTDPLLRADTVNQLCYGCHADKRGPYLWEHAPVVESCLNCHRPHGSNHPALLAAVPPFLCNQCHAQLGGFSHPNDLLTAGNLVGGAAPDERVLNRGCVNCHVRIHGSNHPSGARFHR
jgi:DmsE family decaheme c-type cytochrome